MTTPTDLPQSDFDPAVPHKPADDREEVLFDGKPALRWEYARLWFLVLIGILVLAVPILLAATETASLPWWGWISCIAIAVLLVLIPWIVTFKWRYKISNYRVDVEEGILSKRYDTLELWHVEDIQLDQRIVPRLLGVGTILIFSHADRTGAIHLQGIPQPRKLFETVKQRIIAVKRQRGVIKMDTPVDPHDHFPPAG